MASQVKSGETSKHKQQDLAQQVRQLEMDRQQLEANLKNVEGQLSRAQDSKLEADRRCDSLKRGAFPCSAAGT